MRATVWTGADTKRVTVTLREDDIVALEIRDKGESHRCQILLLRPDAEAVAGLLRAAAQQAEDSLPEPEEG